MIIQKITKKDSLDIWRWRNDRKSIFFYILFVLMFILE